MDESEVEFPKITFLRGIHKESGRQSATAATGAATAATGAAITTTAVWPIDAAITSGDAATAAGVVEAGERRGLSQTGSCDPLEPRRPGS